MVKPLSWLNPAPEDASIIYPRQFPKVVVPSLIGDAGQVLNFPIHRGVGGALRDYGGFGNNAVMAGGYGWVDGPWGWAMNVDGVSGRGEVPHSVSLNISGAVTISLWLRARTIPAAAHAYVVGKGLGEALLRYAVTLNWGNNLSWYIKTVVGTNNWAMNWAPYINIWTYLGVTYDSVAGQMKRCVNATITTLAHTGLLNTGTETLKIGWDGTVAYCGVDIALLRIYNRTLSNPELVRHYEETRAIFGV